MNRGYQRIGLDVLDTVLTITSTNDSRGACRSFTKCCNKRIPWAMMTTQRNGASPTGSEPSMVINEGEGLLFSLFEGSGRLSVAGESTKGQEALGPRCRKHPGSCRPPVARRHACRQRLGAKGQGSLVLPSADSGKRRWRHFRKCGPHG